MKRIYVIGVDGEDLGAESRVSLEKAELVVGGERHLASFGVEEDRTVAFEGDLSEALKSIERAEGEVAVLASGDPGFFGITRLLGERFGPETLTVIPAVSSVSAAFARAGLNWDDATIVSAHGREPRKAVNVCRAHHKVAVLTSPDFGPAGLARELEHEGRTFFVAQKLGEEGECVFRGDAAAVMSEEWEDPNVVLVLDEARLLDGKGWIHGRSESRGGWAFPETEFAHRSAMITKPEVRSLVLARLGPGPGDLIWDVGAGSGSVAVECARLGAAAVAVERDPESCARIRQNAARHGAYVRVVEGEAPEALHSLPEPDAVFVGGSGGGFEEIVKLAAVRARRTLVLTLVTLERVVPAAELLEACGLETEATLLQVSKVKGIGEMHRLAAETPVFVVVGRP